MTKRIYIIYIHLYFNLPHENIFIYKYVITNVDIASNISIYWLNIFIYNIYFNKQNITSIAL